jgi:hypothetical protein
MPARFFTYEGWVVAPPAVRVKPLADNGDRLLASAALRITAGGLAVEGETTEPGTGPQCCRSVFGDPMGASSSWQSP